MRDILEEIAVNQPLDPMESARRGLRTAARARFYGSAGVGEDQSGFTVLLDGKPVRTPARKSLAAPTRSLAEALAAEWEAQQKVIDPAAMPLTRLANAIIDGVAATPQPVADEVVQYLGTDLLFYRADAPAGLVESQTRHWGPVIEWARDGLGARFVLVQGIVHARQPEHAVAAMARTIPRDAAKREDLWRLGAISSVTTLTGSALLALALAHGVLSLDQAWAAAHVDEDWNISQWGSDEEAAARRAFRFTEMQAAAQVLSLLRP